jgi:hypothetical protein
VYLEGRLELAGEADVTLPTEAKQVFVGGRSDNFANFEGRLDEVAVYDRALSPWDVAEHFRRSERAVK